MPQKPLEEAKEEEKKAPKSKKSPKSSAKGKEDKAKKSGSKTAPASKATKGGKAAASPWGKGDPATKQNLKRIKGVGPATEKKLQALGIFQFAQIGKLKAADVPTLATALGINASLIERNEWIKQAKSLSES